MRAPRRTGATVRPGERVVEREPFYALGPGVVVVGEVVALQENGADAWVLGLRLPGLDATAGDWRDPLLFGLDELRPYRARTDKAYFLRRSDLGVLREIAPVEPRNGSGAPGAPERPGAPSFDTAPLVTATAVMAPDATSAATGVVRHAPGHAKGVVPVPSTPLDPATCDEYPAWRRARPRGGRR